MFSQIGLLLVNTLGTLYLVFVFARFLLQFARADFYNPVSQATVKVTSPLLNPLRKIIPGFGGIDVACLVLAFAVHLLVTTALFAISGTPMPSLGIFAAWSLLGAVGLLVNIVFWSMLIVVIISWVNMMAPVNNPLIFLMQQLVEPFLSPFRRIMPDLGGIDLSPILLLVSIQIIEIVLYNGAGSLGMAQKHLSLIIGL